jgi:hypothetical protein
MSCLSANYLPGLPTPPPDGESQNAKSKTKKELVKKGSRGVEDLKKVNTTGMKKMVSVPSSSTGDRSAELWRWRTRRPFSQRRKNKRLESTVVRVAL